MALQLTLRRSARVARGPVVLAFPYLAPHGLFTGDSGRFVTMRDKHSLRELWRRKTRHDVLTGHGTVVVVAYYHEMQGWNEDGKVIWKRKTNQSYLRNGDRLYCCEGPWLEIISIPTGSVVESMECPEGAPVALLGDVLILQEPLEMDPVRAFHIGQRRVLWTKDIARHVREQYGAADPSPATIETGCEGRWLLAREGHVLAFSATDGEARWHCPLHVPHLGLPVKDGRIPIWTTTAAPSTIRTTFDIGSGLVVREQSEPAVGENRLLIVEEATGEIVVDRPLGPYGDTFRRHQEPWRGTVCTNHVVFTTRSGLIAVFRLSDGELVWRYQHSEQIFHPIVEDDRLYVTTTGGEILLFEARGGEL